MIKATYAVKKIPLRFHALNLLFCAFVLFLPALSARAQEQAIESLKQTGEAFREVAKKVTPAVVFIKVEKTEKAQDIPEFQSPFGEQGPFDEEFFRHFFGVPLPKQPHGRGGKPPRVQGQGSGFIVSADGFILTNNHVVGDADKVTVQLQDGRELAAKVVGTDPPSDVALIKVEAKNLPVLPLGDSDALEVGDWVLAVGNPFGLSHSITAGIVSAKGRSSVGITDYENFIQTDAAINPGNSGGPLVDLNGNAVGMNTAIFSRSGGYMGIGFAIPINMVQSIRRQLLSDGAVTRGYLGVVIQDINAELAKNFGLQDNKGALVSQVSEGSPAEKAGIRQGDVIVEFAGKPVERVAELRNRVSLTAPGKHEKITLVRNGERKNLEVTIGTLGGESRKEAPDTPANTQELGMSVQPLTPELARRLGYENESAVVVTRVTPGSAADDAEIRPGTLILEVNRTPVRDLAAYRKALGKKTRDGSILLLVRQGDSTRYVALKLKD